MTGLGRASRFRAHQQGNSPKATEYQERTRGPMKVLVPVKRVVDYNVKIRVKSDGSGVELANVKMSMNPFDEIGVEEALRLREAGKATEVICVSIDRSSAVETIRTRPSRISRLRHPAKADGVVGRSRRRRSRKRRRRREAGLIILGKQAIDDDSNQTGPDARRTARLSQATFASKLVIDGSDVRSREVDGGLQTVKLKGPSIVTTDLRLNSRATPAAEHHEGQESRSRTRPRPTTALTSPPPRDRRPPSRRPRPASSRTSRMVSKLKNEAGVI